jgi:hypothetical protein
LHGLHERAVAITTSVVVQLLDEVTLLLTPDDRNGFRVGGDAIPAVACGTRLRFCLDVVGGTRREDSERKPNPNAENPGKAACKHSDIPPYP